MPGYNIKIITLFLAWPIQAFYLFKYKQHGPCQNLPNRKVLLGNLKGHAHDKGVPKTLYEKRQ